MIGTAYCIALDGGRNFGMTGKSVVTMWMPRNRDAMDIDNVKKIFPIPSTAWFKA
jgi:hypothetical protein